MEAAPQVPFHNAARVPAPCERSPGLFWHKQRHLFTPVPCGRWDCPRCADYKRGAWISRLHTAKPQRFFTLTAAPGSQAALWLATKCLWKDLRDRRGRAWEYFLVCDRNPKGTGLHLHGLQRGDFVPLKQLKNLAHAYGFGEQADIGAIDKIGGVAGYVTRHLIVRDLMIDPAVPRTRRVRYSRHFFPPHAGGEEARASSPGAGALFIRCPQSTAKVVLQCVEQINASIGRYYLGSHGPYPDLGPALSPDAQARKLLCRVSRAAAQGLETVCRLLDVDCPPTTREDLISGAHPLPPVVGP